MASPTSPCEANNRSLIPTIGRFPHAGIHHGRVWGCLGVMSGQVSLHDYGSDIFTEADGDSVTLTDPAPFTPLLASGPAATEPMFIGPGSHITGPVVNGQEHNAFVERHELQPIDRQINGPQLFYGLRYHTHIVKPGEVETFHDQVGYWLWEPAARTIVHTIAMPRGLVLLAAGTAEPNATEFEVSATRGSEVYGILRGAHCPTHSRPSRFGRPRRPQ